MTPLPVTILSLCFLAHVLGDFVLQTEEIVMGKQYRLRVLLWHVVEHALATTMLLVVGWSRLYFAAPGAYPTVPELAVLIGGIAITHFLTDKVKIVLVKRWGRPVFFFVLDQLVHVSVICVAVWLLSMRHPEWGVQPLSPLFLLGKSFSIVTAANFVLLFGALLFVGRAGAVLGWLSTVPLARGIDPATWSAAGLPAHSLKDVPALLKGYALRGTLLLSLWFLPFWPAWIALAIAMLVGWWRWRGQESLRARYLGREWVASLATVLTMGLFLYGARI